MTASGRRRELSLEEIRAIGIDDRDIVRPPFPPFESLSREEQQEIEEEIRKLEAEEAAEEARQR